MALETMGPLNHKPHDRHIMEKQPNDWARNVKVAAAGALRGYRFLLIRKQVSFPRPSHSPGRGRHKGKTRGRPRQMEGDTANGNALQRTRRAPFLRRQMDRHHGLQANIRS